MMVSVNSFSGEKIENCKSPHETKLKSPSEGKGNDNIFGFCALSDSAVQLIHTVRICYGLGFLSAVTRDTGRFISKAMLHSPRVAHILYSFFARYYVKTTENYKVPIHYIRCLRAHTHTHTHTNTHTHTHIYMCVCVCVCVYVCACVGS